MVKQAKGDNKRSRDLRETDRSPDNGAVRTQRQIAVLTHLLATLRRLHDAAEGDSGEARISTQAS